MTVVTSGARLSVCRFGRRSTIVAAAVALLVTAVAVVSAGGDDDDEATKEADDRIDTSDCYVVTIFGLKTADCSKQNSKTVPRSLDSDLQVSYR